MSGTPLPAECELYYVNRDVLFSYHNAAEAFLQRMMSLYVSSHYRNTPNDLQMLADAPAHHLFVLLGPVKDTIPEVLCLIQVALEGEISKKTVKKNFSEGARANGDMIPWTIAQQYQDSDFAGLSGARIVRIATHPEHTKMGYGTRAIELLSAYYQGDIISLNEDDDSDDEASDDEQDDVEQRKGKGKVNLLQMEELIPRKTNKPLLINLQDRKAEQLHYLGTAYGLTQPLFNFWHKNGFVPLYLRLTPNELTGEHSCMMVKQLQNTSSKMFDERWLDLFSADFRERFLSLMSYDFGELHPTLALTILKSTSSDVVNTNPMDKEELDRFFTAHDLKRLDTYSKNLLDYHVVLDLIPKIGQLYFSGKLNIHVSELSQAILLCVALQHRSVNEVGSVFGIPSNQTMALFNKAIRSIAKKLEKVEEAAVSLELPSMHGADDAGEQLVPLKQSLHGELVEAGFDESARLQQKVDNLKEDGKSSKKKKDKKRKKEVEDVEEDEEELEIPTTTSEKKDKKKKKNNKSSKKKEKKKRRVE
eukprot:TRINITY_DN2961_c0_g2_i4.p1 TRINITY_DN2961_c0_g2~~TRINITY_DN2961_c0_g2_i4.p1  ORF type:complete len:533 (-),score=234.41 TRINITY_DN2961_c0_g2_i4:75-1673(-)